MHGRRSMSEDDCRPIGVAGDWGVCVAFNSNLVRVAIWLVPQRVPWDVAFR